MSGPTIRRRPRPRPEERDPPSGRGGDYEVGYGKPPIDTRFGGARGNRSGRKAGVKTLASALERELGAKVKAVVNGRERSMTKREALAMNLVNGAIAGKSQPQRLMFAHLVAGAARPTAALATVPAAHSPIGDDLTAADEAILALFREEILAADKAEESGV